MNGINKVILLGAAGKDPETTYLNDSKVVTRFTLATNKVYNDKNNQKVTETEWHNVEAWGKLAETITNFVKKGNWVAIEGSIKTDKFEAKDGSGTKSVVKVVASDVHLMPKNGNGNGQTQGAPQNYQQAPPQQNYQQVPPQQNYQQVPPQQVPPQQNYQQVPPQQNYQQVPPQQVPPQQNYQQVPPQQQFQQGPPNTMGSTEFINSMPGEDDLPF